MACRGDLHIHSAIGRYLYFTEIYIHIYIHTVNHVFADAIFTNQWGAESAVRISDDFESSCYHFDG